MGGFCFRERREKGGVYFICFASSRGELVLILLLSVSHVLLLADFLNRNSVRFHGKVPSNCYAEATKVQW